MQFDDVIGTLGLAVAVEPWREGWAVSRQTFGQGAGMAFDAVMIEYACRFLEMEPSATEALMCALKRIKTDPALYSFAWHCHRRFAEGPVFSEVEPFPWAAFAEREAPERGLFYAVVLMAGLRRLMQLHARRGINPSVTRDTLDDLMLWMRHYRSSHGEWGLAEFDWLSNHFAGRIFKLGRLQFMFERYAADFTFYRQTGAGVVVALAAAGCAFRPDGQYDGADGVLVPASAWVSTFRDDGETVEGYPVSSDGRVLRDKTVLRCSEWRQVLTKCDLVLSVHIPATGPMDPAACTASFDEAMRFFPAKFPEYDFRAFTCHSWLLDHQLGQYLSPDSNIIKFQRNFHLLPHPGANDKQTLERVFGNASQKPVAAPSATSLQKHIIAHMEAGGHWRDPLGVRFPGRG